MSLNIPAHIGLRLQANGSCGSVFLCVCVPRPLPNTPNSPPKYRVQKVQGSRLKPHHHHHHGHQHICLQRCIYGSALHHRWNIIITNIIIIIMGSIVFIIVVSFGCHYCPPAVVVVVSSIDTSLMAGRERRSWVPRTLLEMDYNIGTILDLSSLTKLGKNL